jgi:hypothetical protein
MKLKCIFSPCKRHRYTLWRVFNQQTWKGDYVQFICLNPSTATDEVDDPTVRRCINYAKSWGYGALCMTNAFSYRATDPEVMKAQEHPTDLANDYWLQMVAKHAGIVVAAWGKDGKFMERDQFIVECISPLHCLGKNKDGTPKHPLYLRKDLKPIRYEIP